MGRVEEIRRRWFDVPPPYDEDLARVAQMDVLTLCDLLDQAADFARFVTNVSRSEPQRVKARAWLSVYEGETE